MEVVVVVIVVVSRADTKLQACCSRHRQSQPRNRVAAAWWPQPGGRSRLGVVETACHVSCGQVRPLHLSRDKKCSCQCLI